MEFVFIWIICGIIAGMIGSSKGAGSSGFFLGFLLGPLGIIIALVMSGNKIKCPYCKKEIDPKAIKCPYCQSEIVKEKISETKGKIIFCVNCGKPNTSDFNYCIDCGTKLSK
jgi:DNA-directed RNA polymerase subunit RPC12/RpoP